MILVGKFAFGGAIGYELEVSCRRLRIARVGPRYTVGGSLLGFSVYNGREECVGLERLRIGCRGDRVRGWQHMAVN